MTPVLGFLPLLVALATSAPTTPTPEPPNGIRQCARSECPVYTVLEDYGSDLYKRRLEPGLWVTKVSPTCNRSEAKTNVYMDLHNYFASNNISRTAPVALEIEENNRRSGRRCPDESDQYPCCEEIFTLAFYIPIASQSSAPEPTLESGVRLVNQSDPRDFYVTVFSGRATVENSTREYDELVMYLDSQGLPYNDDERSIASYDAPWRPLPHRSEVWVPVQSGGRGDGDHGDNDSNSHEDNDEDNDGGRRRIQTGGRRLNDRERRALDYEGDIDLIPY